MSPAFKKTLEDNTFFSSSEAEILRQIKEEFPEELERLKRAYSIRDATTARPETPSPSRIIYDADYDEVNRTLVGVLALRWLVNNQYNTFVGTQPQPVKLQPASFDWLRQVFMGGLNTPADLYALIMSMVINDLGKDPQLASDYQTKTGEDIANENHDMILLKAVKVGMVPCLERLPDRRKNEIILGMELGAEFNFGQLAQAENVPACLSGLLEMREHPRAFEVRFMEQLLDIAGAAGHLDHTCAKKLIEPIYQAYHNVYDVAMGIISAKLDLRTGYDVILVRRNELLVQDAGYRKLDVRIPGDRALMRLHCMAGAANEEVADLYDVALNKILDPETREKLVAHLNVDGSVEKPAVQPTYIPAMLGRGTGNTKNGTVAEKQKALVALLRYLTRVLTVTTSIKSGVTVIERSVMGIKDLLSSDEWKEDPEAVLKDVPVPKDEVAKTAK